MSELISAVEAHKLANPSFPEGLSRYQDIVAQAVTDASMGGVTAINLRIPVRFELEIVSWLNGGGYQVTQLEDSIEEHSFYTISWSNAT